MIKTIVTLILIHILSPGCGQLNNNNHTGKTAAAPPLLSRQTAVGGACDGCGLMYEGMPSPATLSWSATIAPAGEPGEPMEISGTIYKPDGTPAPGILLYVYHTDAKGIYSPAKNQTAAKRHGHLRGWMITNDKGQYKFTSIRPASYPNLNFSAHIHPLIKEPGKTEYYIDEFVFADDPKLTPEEKSNHRNRGGTGILQITKNEKGVWVARRDITLGLNIPDYK